MWKYEKALQYPINIKKRDPRLAKVIITQYGGAQGELAAALRYLNQRYTMPDAKGRALLTDIGSEELNHVEMVCSMVYQLTKGVSYKIILNFKDATTFKDAAFASSNESGLFVGSDGTLSPLEEGYYTISVTLDDGFSKGRKLEIFTKVSNASVINDLSNFLIMIRKSVGHFGAFLVYGIASTFFFQMIFDKKNWLFAGILNISQGFGIATFTEFIQLFVVGRIGTFNDVLIDFTGFICSSIFITLVFIGIEVFKYFKAKKEKVN